VAYELSYLRFCIQFDLVRYKGSKKQPARFFNATKVIDYVFYPDSNASSDFCNQSGSRPQRAGSGKHPLYA
jgi:hypothetical protein